MLRWIPKSTSHFLSSNRLFYFIRKEKTKRCTAKLRWIEEMHFKQAHQLNVADINLWENTSLSDCFSRNSPWRCFFCFFLFMSRRIVQFHPPIELVNIDTRFDTNGRRDPLLSMDIGLLVKCPSETSSNLHCGPLHRSQLLFTCHCGWQVKQIHPSLLKITKLRSSSSLSPN